MDVRIQFPRTGAKSHPRDAIFAGMTQAVLDYAAQNYRLSDALEGLARGMGNFGDSPHNILADVLRALDINVPAMGCDPLPALSEYVAQLIPR